MIPMFLKGLLLTLNLWNWCFLRKKVSNWTTHKRIRRFTFNNTVSTDDQLKYKTSNRHLGIHQNTNSHKFINIQGVRVYFVTLLLAITFML